MPEAVRVSQFDSVDDPTGRNHLHRVEQREDLAFPGAGLAVLLRDREGGPGERRAAEAVSDDRGTPAVPDIFWDKHRSAGPGALGLLQWYAAEDDILRGEEDKQQVHLSAEAREMPDAVLPEPEGMGVQGVLAPGERGAEPPGGATSGRSGVRAASPGPVATPGEVPAGPAGAARPAILELSAAAARLSDAARHGLLRAIPAVLELGIPVQSEPDGHVFEAAIFRPRSTVPAMSAPAK